MEPPKIKPAIIIVVSAAILLLALVFSIQKNFSLSGKYRALFQSSKALETSIIELQSENESLTEKLDQLSLTVGHADMASTEIKEELNRLRDENENLQFEMKKNEETMKSAVEEKSYLEDMLINKTKEIESLSAPNLSTGQISLELTKKDAEIRQLNDQNRLLLEKLDRLYKITTAKITEINVAKITLEETLATAKQTIDQEWNTVNLGEISTGTTTEPQPRTGPKKEGKILAVNDAHGFVVVDLGKVDSLPQGANLSVFREGKNIATLSILEVRDVMTACNIKHLSEGEKLQINDVVLLQK